VLFIEPPRFIIPTRRANTPSIVPELTEVTTAAVAIQLGSVCGSFMATAIADGVRVLKIVRRLLGTPDIKRGSEACQIQGDQSQAGRRDSYEDRKRNQANFQVAVWATTPKKTAVNSWRGMVRHPTRIAT
jgi:hypothetical protein